MLQSSKFRGLTRIAVPLFIASMLIAGVILFEGTTQAPTANAAATSRTTASWSSSEDYEIYFMEHMMDHHYAAVQMSQPCLQKAYHEQLRNLCQTIITSQQHQIQQMQGWLLAWYGIHYSPQLAVPYQHLVSFLNSINGNTFEVGQFDLWFMQNMNAHHAIAIARAQVCLQKATHTQLKNACSMIISSQSMEIQEEQIWLCQWYNLCEERKA